MVSLYINISISDTASVAVSVLYKLLFFSLKTLSPLNRTVPNKSYPVHVERKGKQRRIPLRLKMCRQNRILEQFINQTCQTFKLIHLFSLKKVVFFLVN